MTDNDPRPQWFASRCPRCGGSFSIPQLCRDCGWVPPCEDCVASAPWPPPPTRPSGVLLDHVDDRPKLRRTITFLYGLLDQIGTLDDVVRVNDEAYRRLAQTIQQARHSVVTSDGKDLFLTDL